MITKIKNAVLVYHGLIKNHYLYIEDGVISAVTEQNLPCDKEIDAEGNYVSCGFIDIHTHGGGGFDFMDGTAEDIVEAAKMHFKHGTTTIYPTATSSSFDDTVKFIENAAAASQNNDSDVPHMPGTHLEGPYFSLEMCGAQNPEYIKTPDLEECRKFLEAGKVSRMSFAPELPDTDKLCDFLTKNGVVPAFGHTAAIYEEIMPLCEKGCTLATHLYSGMNTVTRRNLYRKLGAVETALLEDDITVEIIADGQHLPIELLRFIVKNKGKDKVILITDSMRGAGMGEGTSLLGPKHDGMECKIKNGVAILNDESAFAGSVATSDLLVRTMLEAGVTIYDAIQMITENPAKAMKLDTKGKMEVGYDADLVFFDEGINIKRVMKGR